MAQAGDRVSSVWARLLPGGIKAGLQGRSSSAYTASKLVLLLLLLLTVRRAAVAGGGCWQPALQAGQLPRAATCLTAAAQIEACTEQSATGSAPGR